MKIDRRKFIKIGTLTAANLTVLSQTGTAALLDSTHKNTDDKLPLPDKLEQYFITPPDDVKSSCYWWWFNGLVDKEGITRDLEEFRKKGMGGVLLVNSAGGLGGVSMPQGVEFLSEDWKELYRYAMKEADRLGIEVGVNLSSGWCMGGPWIKPEDSGRWFLQSKLNVAGPQKFSGALPLPGNRDGYDKVFNPPGFKDYIDLPLDKLDYRDTAVVAILVADDVHARFNGERLNLLSAKTNRKDASNFMRAADVMGPTRSEWKNEPGDQPVPLNKVIDLTSKMKPGGLLDWDVPPGNWTIIRTGHRMTGSRLMIAQPEADGLSVDWFESKGVEIQFEHIGKVLLEENAKVKSKALKYFCDDSFEDGFPNWTDKILTHFVDYCGYDPKPYLPVLAGYIIQSAEVSDRFLNDYRKTIANCMADGHYKRFAELCHDNGLLVQNESAGPSRSGTICMDGLKNLGRSDLPMGEFWLGPKHDDEATLANNQPYGVSRLEDGQNKVTKMVASAAHIYGKNLVSAESFTTMRHWLDYPGSLKQALDRAFCEGINRIAIHTSTATRPKDGKPGYEYGAGTHFNPNVTWWEKSGDFFSYIARCQHLLRQGKFVADVLYYNGDLAPNLVPAKHVDPSLGKGYDYDVCNEEVLLTRLSVRNNRIVLPDGMSYRLLVLPADNRMPVKVIAKIEELVKAGATVVGSPPDQDSGLKNYPACDDTVKQIALQVWGAADGKTVKLNHYGKGRVFYGETIRNVLLNDGIGPDFEYAGDDNFIDFIHRNTTGAEIYFITNRQSHTVITECTFRSQGTPQVWDAVKGTMIKSPQFKNSGKNASLTLEFAPFQSWFVVFRKDALPGKTKPVKLKRNYPVLSNIQDLDGTWQVKFDSSWGGPESAVEFTSLTDWSTNADERIKYYSGKAIYSKKFSVDNGVLNNKGLFLDLGVVKDIASVKLNGHDLGVVWTSPWRVNISGLLKQTDNLLQIEVINLWPNRLIGDAALPEDKRLTHTNIPFKKTDELLPSGLLGPVVIKVEST